MSFLSIPSQQGLFVAIQADRDAGAERRRSPSSDNDDDEEDDDDTENVRLIPRCSPVPRKRGASIHDETAEYMRIHLALSAGKRVSFADTTGGDLVDVKEFVAFESDDEEDAERWEEEQAKYRQAEREPTYLVRPEFNSPAGDALLRAVHANKVEVEQICAADSEPLAFTGVIRVQNVSFHKAVYIRSTMDSWATYFDHPAEYVQGSHDGATDKFSFRLSFAPPYVTHGSRIEFVVRYETSDGDYWANNSSMNYAVTLLLSYEDDAAQNISGAQQVKGILKAPKAYSMINEFDSEDEQEKNEDEAGTSKSGLIRPTAACPVIIQPEIDVEIAVHPSGHRVSPNQELPSVDGTLSAHAVSPGGHFPCMSSETSPQTNLSLEFNESVQPNKSQPLPRRHSELGKQASELPVDTSPSRLLPAPTSSQSQLRSDHSQADGEETPPTEASCLCTPSTEMNLRPKEEVEATHSLATYPCPELPAEHIPAPALTPCWEPEVAAGSSELVAKGPNGSAARHEGGTPAPSSPVAEAQPRAGARAEVPLSPELTGSASSSAGVTEASQNLALQAVSASEEREDALQISPGALSENLPNTPSEHDVNRNLMPSIIALSGVVSLSTVLQQPSALFLIGLLLVLHRL